MGLLVLFNTFPPPFARPSSTWAPASGGSTHFLQVFQGIRPASRTILTWHSSRRRRLECSCQRKHLTLQAIGRLESSSTTSVIADSLMCTSFEPLASHTLANQAKYDDSSRTCLAVQAPPYHAFVASISQACQARTCAEPPRANSATPTLSSRVG